ncbi:hypothetical protein Cgig2_034137 [Carnegiea gigantea]|uniref:Reverse transcriptase domain-containing protein n=1 Tax=Carnegiea gigantea TaxID=171969 RepID=A0A9Q1KEI7_9CARY|nr:hypothetical protein Cgig2_034137 [Carnegiea gigantea]
MILGEAIQHCTNKRFLITYPTWATLQNWAVIIDDPWCVLRDFNSVLHPGERMGGIEVSEGEICSFANYITQSGLHKFPYVGAFLTWTNKSIWSKIDRALYNEYWHDTFAFTHTFTHKRQGPELHYVKSRHNSSRTPVTQIYYTEKKQPQTIMWKSINMLFHSLNNKARDECSKVFITKIKQRKAMTRIYTIRNHHDQWIEGFAAVTEVMTAFYKTLLGTKDPCRILVDQNVINQGPRLSIDQQYNLCKPFSDSEIKQVIFSIPNHKSPGLDGYNSTFYKASWGSLGHLICSTIRELFSTGEMSSFYGETKLVILPKVQNPERAKDFRPISCCNMIYKCIIKLLCTRLKEVLPMIINPSQGAFVKGRELLFSVLLCQDLVRGYNRKHTTPSCIMKVDLHKAFDSVH